MKSRYWILPAVVIFSLISCGGPGEIAQENPPSVSLEYFQDGYFQAVLPSWDQVDDSDPETLYMIQQEGQFVAINRYRQLPDFVAEQFKAHIADEPGAFLVREDELAGKPFFEYTTREENQTRRVQIVLEYCLGQTYALAAGGRDSVENAALFQQVLASSSCQDPYTVSKLPVGKIGMMVNPAGDDHLESYYPALRLAKENGVQVVHSYLSWAEVEPRAGERFWEWQDYLMGYRIQEGFEISLVVNLIHTNLRGPMPADLAGMDFDDPEFIQRFGDFILDVLDRYPVQYLSLGNEVNDYFVNQRDQIPAYRTFFLAIKEQIQQHHPDLKVAMTFAFHDALSNDSLDIIEELNLGDFLPLTLYLYSPGFKFDRDPAELEENMDRIFAVADGKPVAFAEIGWSTADSLGGREQDQADFIKEAFRVLALNRDQIEYLGWFDLHDSLLENAYQAALTFLAPDAPLIQDEEYMRDFSTFLNYMGLIENDGSPKLGWYVFQEEAKLYLGEFQE